MYDFHKFKKKGCDDQVFKHPFFLRDKRNLLSQIKRKSNSSHPVRKQKVDVEPGSEQKNKRQKKQGMKELGSETKHQPRGSGHFGKNVTQLQMIDTSQI